MADQQALIDAITAAITAAAQAAAPGPNFGAVLQTAVTNAIAAAQAAVPPAGAFALHPATVSANVIDYSTRQGAALYRAATEPLHANDVLYSLKDPNNGLLIEDLTTRASESGWGTILTVTTATGAQNLLEFYGAITRAEITAHVQAILANNDRSNQNDTQLLVCLQHTTDEWTKTRMAASHSDWRTTPTGGAANVNSGLLYLYTLLEKSEVQKRTLCSHIKLQLVDMKKIMSKAKYKVDVFNTMVEKHLRTLNNYKNPLSEEDLVNYLFIGYLSCKNQEFTATFAIAKDDWEYKGATTTSEALMKMALQKYEAIKLAGNWDRVSHEEGQIIALTAQLNKLQNNKGTSTQKATAATTKSASASTANDNPKKRKKDDRVPLRERKWTGDNKWRGVAPNPGEPTTKVVNGKTWYWCPYHKCWTNHMYSACEAAKKAAAAAKAKGDKLTASMAEIGIEDVMEEDD